MLEWTMGKTYTQMTVRSPRVGEKKGKGRGNAV